MVLFRIAIDGIAIDGKRDGKYYRSIGNAIDAGL